MSNIIVDDIGKVVEAMRDATAQDPDAPYYMFGHRMEISKRLTEKNKDRVFKYKKYPLVALKMDIQEDKANGVISYSLNIAILAFTQENWNAEERYNNVFKPILLPLYEKFIEKLKSSGLFMWPGNQDFPEHTKIDRPFWGIEQGEGNVKKIFGDPLDAIELINLKLKQRIKNC